MQKAGARDPGPALDTDRSNRPYEARRHKDSGKEVELVIISNATIFFYSIIITAVAGSQPKRARQIWLPSERPVLVLPR